MATTEQIHSLYGGLEPAIVLTLHELVHTIDATLALQFPESDHARLHEQPGSLPRLQRGALEFLWRELAGVLTNIGEPPPVRGSSRWPLDAGAVASTIRALADTLADLDAPGKPFTGSMIKRRILPRFPTKENDPC